MKVLIVNERVSNQFLLIEQLQTHLELENRDIRIASNGLEAITVAEKHDLDLILMELHLPVMDGLTATTQIISKHPHIKVIIITSSDDIISIQKSINVGVTGYLLKDNATSSLIPTIQNILNGYTVFPKRKVVTNKLLVNSDNIIPFENPQRILKINKIIASETIKQWTYQQKVSSLNEGDFLKFFEVDLIDKQELINYLIQEKTSKCNLIEELNLRFDRLILKYFNSDRIEINNNELEEKFEAIIERVNYWLYTEYETANFGSFKVRLEINAQKLRINLAQQFKEFIGLALLQISPMPCLEYFEFIESILCNTIKDYQSELEKYIKQEKSAFNAYKVLLDISFESNNRESQQGSIDSLARAILCIYQAKIRFEASKLAIHVLEGMVRSLKFNIDDLILTNNLMENILNQLGIFNVDPQIISWLHHKFSSFQDSGTLLQEIEAELGYSINQWGIKPQINPDLVIDKLMAKISINSSDILDNIERELYV